MKKQVELDLQDAAAILESLKAGVAGLSRQERIDLAARVCGIAKSAVEIADSIKSDIKVWRRGRKGYVVGEIFKAFLNVFPVQRLDQQKLKVDYPRIYNACLVSEDQQRVTFEPR